MYLKYFLLLILSLGSFKAVSQSITYEKWLEKSANFIDANKLDSAAMALRKAMALEPTNKNNAVLLLHLGILQRQLGQTDDAYISFTASLSSSPDSLLVLHNRASLLCYLERFDEAKDDYNTILKLDSKNAEAYYRRGVLFLEENNRTKAIADFLAADKAQPGSLFTKLSKALMLKLDGDWSGAEKVYSDIIASSDIIDSSFYMNRAECYVYTNQLSKAMADLNAAEQKERSNPYFYILRGKIRLNQFDKLAAKEDFLKAKSLGYDKSLVDDLMKKVK